MGWFGHSDAFRFGAAMVAVAAVTLTLGQWLRVSNAATVSTTYLMVVLPVAATSRLRVAVATSIAAMLCLNFFFLPPVGTFTIADPQNWVVLFAFLAVSLVASHLSAVAQARTQEAIGRRDELARLFDLGRDVLLMTDSREALPVLARSIARRFDLEFVAVAVPREDEWDVYEAGAHPIELDRRQLSNAFAAAQATLEFDAYARTYAGHRTMTV
jgi:two-component system sensor histidine kinase KdpD